MRGMDRILELQGLDTASDRLGHRREQLEAGEELSSARKEMEESEARLGELRLAIDAVASEQRRLEHEIDSMGAKLAAEEKRMYDGSIANAKELDALQHEISSLKDRRSRAEDDLLDQMMRREELEGRVAQSETEVATTRERVEAVGGDASRELDEIVSSLAAQHVERESIVREIDAELLELYEDLRGQKKGIGAAAIVDGVCQACHEKLSAVELDKLKHTDGVKRCEYCRRIVVFD